MNMIFVILNTECQNVELNVIQERKQVKCLFWSILEDKNKEMVKIKMGR